jgi:hypothetical protein
MNLLADLENPKPQIVNSPWPIHQRGRDKSLTSDLAGEPVLEGSGFLAEA